MSFFVTFASIVYIELLQNWGDNVTKNDTLLVSFLFHFSERTQTNGNHVVKESTQTNGTHSVSSMRELSLGDKIS